tara:strand:+ start:17531 stop:18577 length:1047 start_codon:yes stop_codon:yes gene_type:complete
LTKFYSLKVAKIKEETKNSVSITFDVPSDLKENYSFQSGQYVTLKAKIKGNLVLRSYSICSSPNSGFLQIGVKAISNGVFSNYVNNALREGDMLEVSKPEGRFVVETPDIKNNFIGIAAGSGITPIISILKNVLISNEESKFILLFGNKSIKETMFYREIENLKDLFGGRFFCYNIYSMENNPNSEFGRIDASFITFCLKKHDNIKFDKTFICGPEKLIQNCSSELIKLGYNEKNILFELFYSSTENQKPNQIESEETKASITCDYEDFEISIPKNMTILDAALNQNIDVPYSCQGGVCSSCIGKVTNGSAKMIENNILTDQEIKDGLVLACQAIPLSNSISIDFDDV